ncbi:MAG: cistern family PEP-CTERM protein [Phormidium sp.]
MLKHFPKLILGLSALAAVEILSLTTAPAASAASMTNGFDLVNGDVGIDRLDIGKEFTVLFDGNVSERNVSGLSSEAIFKLLAFNTVGSTTEAQFEITLTNTTSGSLFSRTSALGFDVFNFNGTSIGSTLSLVGIGNASGSGNTRTVGLFVNDNSGAFPNQFGDVDVCFTNGNTCQGGTSGGVDNNPSTSNPETGRFTATLAMSGDVQRMALSNFGVRYQSIDGTSATGQRFNGDSGTGRGTVRTPQPPSSGGGTRKIPEPSTTLALGVVAISALKLRKRNSVAQA